MKYNGMPAGMWMMFKKPFQEALITDLGYNPASAKFASHAGAMQDAKHDRGNGFLWKQMPDEMNADCVLLGEPSGVDAISFSTKGYNTDGKIKYENLLK